MSKRALTVGMLTAGLSAGLIAGALSPAAAQGHEVGGKGSVYFLSGALNVTGKAQEAYPFGNPDDEVTTEVDASDHLDAKVAAMRAHRTQIAVDGPFFALSNNVGQRAFGVEHFVLARGPRGAGTGPLGREGDLFAGL